jgi:uncharacterized protein
MEDAMSDVSELFAAVGRGEVETVSRMITGRPALARARDASALSILRFAGYMDQDVILGALIDGGPPPDIFEAAMIDDGVLVRRIVASDPSQASAFSVDGFTAMHFAAFFGAVAAMAVLLDAGADTEAVTRNFLTIRPLHAAAAGGYVEACELLLDRGAQVNAVQHGAHTPLHAPAFSNNRVLAELLLGRGASAAMKNDEGKTPADVAAGLGNMELAALLRCHE